MPFDPLRPEYAAGLEVVQSIEERLVPATGTQRWVLQAHVAWYQRQRDKARAQALAAELEPLLRGAVQSDLALCAVLARVLLVRAEQPWLDGDTHQAQALAQEALALGAAQGDALLVGDAHALLAHIVWQRGEDNTPCFQAAHHAYAQAGDARRRRLLGLREIFGVALRDLVSARAMLANLGQDHPEDQHPSVKAWRLAVEANVLEHAGDYASALEPLSQAVDAALASGQHRVAAIWSGNLGIYLRNLHDLSGSLMWCERALALARQLDSRVMQATGLSQLGSLLGKLKRYDDAVEILVAADEAMVAGSEARAYNSHHLACVFIAMSDWERAALWLGIALPQLFATGRRVSINTAQLDLATVYAGQGHIAQAQQLGWQALADARQHHLRSNEVAALQTLADLCLLDPSVQSARQALGHLQQALAVARSIPGFQIEPKLLESLAAQWARQGDFEQAYRHLQEAAQARERVLGLEVGQRAAGLQVRYRTERLRQEADVLRRLSESEAQRANDLAVAHDTLAQLAQLGRELTAMVTESQVFEALEGYLYQFLDVSVMSLYLLEAETATLKRVYGRRQGQPLPALHLALDEPDSAEARCALERRVLRLESTSLGDDSAERQSPTGQASDVHFMMLAPLMAGDTVLGVLAVQNEARHPYSEREESIFCTLCAYGAIALVNAQALTRLRQAQEQLMAQNMALEQLAVTDALTGLPNRRQLDTVLSREVARAARYGTPLVLILLDIDHFKRINDEHGHLLGDEVLAALGHLLRHQLRQTDVVGRWGGEEFLVICPSIELSQGLHIAETLRAAVARLVQPAVGPLSVSLGVAGHRPGDTAVTCVARADAALYAAKRAGRNRVEAER